MPRSAILTLLVGCCAFCFSQQLSFSRQFDAIKKNVPLAIINTQPDCFYVLRYNKAVHDFTIERRAKPSAEIIAFTPLKLDSVNANWFNYENLDYLFFEQDRKLYFVFEKVLNTKRAIYLKIIDTLGKSSGFIELASLDKEKAGPEFSFEFKRTATDNILIIASQTLSGTVRKTAMLFDTRQRKMSWVKKLPLENGYTGFSTAFESNSGGDLFYILVKSRVLSYQRKYANGQQVSAPVLFYDTLSLVSYLNNDPVSIYKKPILANLSHVNSMHLLADEDNVKAQVHFALRETEDAEAKIYFLNIKLSRDLGREFYAFSKPLPENLKKQLTFYDGSDSKLAEDKEYLFFKQFIAEHSGYQVSERKEGYYYKELLVWQTDLSTGNVSNQLIIPRKIMAFKGRMRFKNIGEAMPVFFNNRLSLVVLEASGNLKKPADDFDFHKFKKETNLWKANIVMYQLNDKGTLEKSLLYHNSDFDLVPVKYQGKSNDVVFYLSSGKYEKFAILKLNPF